MISKDKWRRYVDKLAAIDNRAAAEMEKYIEIHGLADGNALIEYAYGLATKYGEASAELACEMYDLMAQTQRADVPAAVPAETATMEEVARDVGWAKYHSPSQIPSKVGRFARQAGADTMLHNAERDGVQWAWVPMGDTCAFCITLASRGWQYASDAVKRGRHASHIHANCDCTFAIAHNEKAKRDYDYIYDPNRYKEMYDGAEGKTPAEKINSLRRIRYQENREYINAQKRDAYQARQFADNNQVKKGNYQTTSIDSKYAQYYETTEEWDKQAKPEQGSIVIAPYTTTMSGEEYHEGALLPDGKRVKLKKEDGDDLAVGSWFKNKFWGDVLFQRGVEYPLSVKSADLILNKCPLIDVQTIEIKTIRSKRSDGFVRRIKDAYGQSPNVLVDVTNYPFDLDFIRSEVPTAFDKMNWLNVLLIKKGEKFIAFKRA